MTQLVAHLNHDFDSGPELVGGGIRPRVGCALSGESASISHPLSLPLLALSLSLS